MGNVLCIKVAWYLWFNLDSLNFLGPFFVIIFIESFPCDFFRWNGSDASAFIVIANQFM
jgi:hypothetical protein